jgi:subtilisin-like proprotein convertase family protein
LAAGFALAGSAQAAPLTVDINAGGPTMDGYEDGFDEVPGVTDFTFTVGQHGTIADLDVRLAFSHDFMEDATVELIAPGGTTSALFTQLATGQYGDFKDAIFDDRATQRVGSVGNLGTEFVGSYKTQLAADDLVKFNGLDAFGTWTLRVSDALMVDTGYVYAAGQTAPWGTALGTALLITVPEPASLSLLALSGLAMLRRRRR